MTRIGNLVTKSMTVLDSTSENRFFEGYLTVEMKDKQGEITVVDELYKVLPIWVDRGAPITDTHSNRVIGKGINFAKTTVTEGGVTYPAIKITGKIHKNYELDTDIWEKIKSGEYKGLSFGGATKANRVPKVMKDGDIAYALTDLEHYEVAVCKDPAVPLALITDYNTLAKATIPSVPRGDGKEVIKCDKFGCYVIKSEGKDEPEYYDESIIKGEDFSNADGTTPATVTNTVSQSTQTAKPIKTDTKVGVPESEGGLKINVTPLEGGIADNQYTKNDTPSSTGVGGGVRANIPDGINRQDTGGSSLITEDIEELHKSDLNKVIGAILAGVHRIKSRATAPTKEGGSEDSDKNLGVDRDDLMCPKQHYSKEVQEANKSSQSFASGSPSPKKPKKTVTAFGDDDKKDNWNKKPEGEAPHWKTPKDTHGDKDKPKKKSWETWLENKSLGALGWGKLNRDGTKQKLRKKQPKLDDFVDEKKSGYTTEDGNIQLGNPSIPTENKEKLVSSLGAQNKQTKVTIREKSNWCPSCGKKITDDMKETYRETKRPHADCPTCDQNKRIAERDRKDDAKMERIQEGIHRDLSSGGQKVTRFSGGRAPKTYNS